MKRAAVFLWLLSAGCSTAPVADMLDFFKPGHLRPETTAPYGGVCVPRPVGGVAVNPPSVAGPAVTGPLTGPPPIAPISPPPPPAPVSAAPLPAAPVSNPPDGTGAASHLGAPTLLTPAADEPHPLPSLSPR